MLRKIINKRRETLIIKLNGNDTKNINYGGIYVEVSPYIALQKDLGKRTAGVWPLQVE